MAVATISNELKKELLALDKDTITASQIANLFGNTISKPSSGDKSSVFAIAKPKFDTRMKMHLDAGEYINKEAVDTHVGIFLFNKLLIEGSIDHAIPNGYYNEVLTAKKFNALLDIIANETLNGNIPIIPNLHDFLKRYEFWSLKLVAIFSPSFTKKLLMPDEKIEKAKEDILKDIENKDMTAMVNAEDTLVAMADKVTDKDPGKTIFNSGARGSFENDYKNMMLSVGPTMNPVTGEYDFIKSSYLGGIQKEDLAAAANIIINAEYPKALGTAKGGYLTKQFYAVFQNLVFGEKDSDCHTNQGIIVKITEDNLDEYIDQYAFSKTGLELITKDNVKKWVGKTIKIRSPLFCIDEHTCNKCAGERFYKMGISAVGLTTTNVTSKILNSSLKLRHSLKIKLNTVDVNKLLK